MQRAFDKSERFVHSQVLERYLDVSILDTYPLCMSVLKKSLNDDDNDVLIRGGEAVETMKKNRPLS